MLALHKLGQFYGGLRLKQHKDESMSAEVQTALLPKQLIIPLQQHIGAAAIPVVEIGQHVRKAQVIAKASDYVSAAVHAPSSGTVIAIEERPIAHPSGQSAVCIVINTDGDDKWRWRKDPSPDFLNIDPSALRNIIREAGIVGLGGAGFPSFIKLNPVYNKEIDVLILNGAECEPYITCDAMIMQLRAREIIDGLLIMRHALQANQCIIGIENNKQAAFNALKDALHDDELEFIRIQRIATIYPAGGEKQLIKVLTKKEVPSHGLPIDIGVICQNVATALAIYRAVVIQEPLISRYVTITGDAINKPQNLEVLIGTPISEILEYCEINRDITNEIVVGGPMMGFNLNSDEAPVVKTTNCLLALTTPHKTTLQASMPCIRCGECARVCPAQLLPQQLYWYAKAKDFDGTQNYNLFDCIECGCCAYVCPSHIPLVQYYRYAKTAIFAQERDKQKSELALERHEFREFRLQREKLEKAERQRQKKEKLKLAKATSEPIKQLDPDKVAIEAAMVRVKLKQGEQKNQRRNVKELTDAQRIAIAEVDKRRQQQRNEKIKQAHSNKSIENSANESASSKLTGKN